MVDAEIRNSVAGPAYSLLSLDYNCREWSGDLLRRDAALVLDKSTREARLLVPTQAHT